MFNLHLIVPDPSEPLPVYRRPTLLKFAVVQAVVLLLGLFFMAGAWIFFLNPVELGSDQEGIYPEFFGLAWGIGCLSLVTLGTTVRLLKARASVIVVCTCVLVGITVFGLVSAIVFVLGVPGWWKIAVVVPVSAVFVVWVFLREWWKGELGYRRGTHDARGLPLEGADELRQQFAVVSPRQLPVPVDSNVKWYALAPLALTVVYAALHWALATAFGGFFSWRVTVLWIAASLGTALFTIGLAGFAEQMYIEWHWRVSFALWGLAFVVVFIYTVGLAFDETTPVRFLAPLPAIWGVLFVIARTYAARTRRAAYEQVVADFTPDT